MNSCQYNHQYSGQSLIQRPVPNTIGKAVAVVMLVCKLRHRLLSFCKNDEQSTVSVKKHHTRSDDDSRLTDGSAVDVLRSLGRTRGCRVVPAVLGCRVHLSVRRRLLQPPSVPKAPLGSADWIAAFLLAALALFIMRAQRLVTAAASEEDTKLFHSP